MNTVFLPSLKLTYMFADTDRNFQMANFTKENSLFGPTSCPKLKKRYSEFYLKLT